MGRVSVFSETRPPPFETQGKQKAAATKELRRRRNGAVGEIGAGIYRDFGDGDRVYIPRRGGECGRGAARGRWNERTRVGASGRRGDGPAFRARPESG